MTIEDFVLWLKAGPAAKPLTYEQLEDLAVEIETQTAMLAAARTDAKSAREAVTMADKEIADTRARFDGLKKMIAELRTDNDHLRGYIVRVEEDDLARDGYVEVRVGDEVVMRPKRQPQSRQPINQTVNGEAMVQRERDYGNRAPPKRVHWVEA